MRYFASLKLISLISQLFPQSKTPFFVLWQQSLLFGFKLRSVLRRLVKYVKSIRSIFSGSGAFLVSNSSHFPRKSTYISELKSYHEKEQWPHRDRFVHSTMDADDGATAEVSGIDVCVFSIADDGWRWRYLATKTRAQQYDAYSLRT